MKTKLTWAGKPVKTQYTAFMGKAVRINHRLIGRIDIECLLKNYPAKTELKNILKEME